MNPSVPNPDLYNLPWTIDSYHGMPYQNLGSSGLKASSIGLGTWKFGYPETGDEARVDEKAALEILDHAVDQGVTFWDTANRYNNASGNSERILGKWFKSNPSERRNVVIATKLFGSMDGMTPNHCRLSRGNILDSTYASLERLQIDWIDLLYFHDFDPKTSAEESLLAIEDLISQDIVRYFAVSNFTVDQLNIYRTIEKHIAPRSRIVAVQNQFDILSGEGQAYRGVLEYCSQVCISFIAWSPLARGLITERYLDPSKARKGDRLYDEGTLDKDVNEDVIIKLRMLAKLAQMWALEVSQLAIAYMLRLPGMGPVIPSVSNLKQLVSNAKAGKISLSINQMEQVKEGLSQ